MGGPGKKRTTLRQLRRSTGILSHASKVIHGARPFTRRVLQLLKLFNSGAKRIRLSEDFRLDMEWWSRCASTFNGSSPILSNRKALADLMVPTVSENYLYASQGLDHITGSFRMDNPYKPSESLGAGSSNCIITVDCLNSNVGCIMSPDIRYDGSARRLLCVLCVCLLWGHKWSCSNVFVLSTSRRLVRSLRKGCANNDLEADIIRDIFWLSVLYDFRLIPFYI